jgi:hypothetical protein
MLDKGASPSSCGDEMSTHALTAAFCSSKLDGLGLAVNAGSTLMYPIRTGCLFEFDTAVLSWGHSTMAIIM